MTTALDKAEQGEVTRAERTRSCRCYRPNVDIVETAGELTVLADMPGATRDNIDISFENGTLTIHGAVKDRQREVGNMLLAEYGVGDFHRVFQVGEMIDASRITAEFSDGVLTLHLPKAESVKPRKISVQTN
jgi:HSP20 family protein